MYRSLLLATSLLVLAFTGHEQATVNCAAGGTVTAIRADATGSASVEDVCTFILGPTPIVPPPPVNGVFRMVVLPDTQHYTDHNRPERHAIFHTQTQWIADQREALNIRAVIHLGDIVDRSGNEAQWQVADAAMARLEPSPIPLAFAYGNHDSVHHSSSLHPHYFGYDRFQGNPGYCGASLYGSSKRTMGTCHLVDDDWLIIALGWFAQWGDLTGVTSVDGIPHGRTRLPLQFLRDKAAEYPTRKVIVVLHGYLRADGTRIQEYDWTFDHVFAPIPNLVMVLNGHELGQQAEHYRADVAHGRTVHQMLSNYQGRANGGDGWLRILTFEGDTVSVQTYSPWLGQFETDANSQFTFLVGQ